MPHRAPPAGSGGVARGNATSTTHPAPAFRSPVLAPARASTQQCVSTTEALQRAVRADADNWQRGTPTSSVSTYASYQQAVCLAAVHNLNDLNLGGNPTLEKVRSVLDDTFTSLAVAGADVNIAYMDGANQDPADALVALQKGGVLYSTATTTLGLLHIPHGLPNS